MKKRIIIFLALVSVFLLSYTKTDNVKAYRAVDSDLVDAKLSCGDTMKLSVPSNKKAKWRSYNTLIATVDQNGKVLGKRAGEVLIEAKTSNKTYTWLIQVMPKVKTVYEYDVSKPIGISCKKKTLLVGKTFTLKLNGINYNEVKWTSSNKKVATVSRNGKVTAKKAGNATIKADVGKKAYRCKIVVSEKTLSVNKKSISLLEGKKTKIIVTLKTNKKDKFDVDIKNPNIAGYEYDVWNGNKLPVIIEGFSKGKTSLVISNKLTKEKITVKINVQANKKNNYEDDEDDFDYNDDYEDNKDDFDIDGVESTYDAEEHYDDDEDSQSEDNSKTEYDSFRQEWLTKDDLYDNYGIRLLWYGERIDLYINLIDDKIIYSIYGTPKSEFKVGVIYTGVYNEKNIRLQYFEEIVLDGKERKINSICINKQDLIDAGIINK